MNELIQKVLGYNPNANIELLKKAFAFADKVHIPHKRLSGESYIIHPLAVANILADLEQEVEVIAAAFLHDVMEDGGITSEEITTLFGSEIAKLVEGVTKLSQFSFVSREERQAENFRKMFVAMGEDYRVIVIKLADRLHNMQTLQYLSPEKQQETALETREIFAPLAHRMGMWRIKWQLEDLAFRYLEPEPYQQVRQKVSQRYGEREQFITDFIALLKELVNSVGIQPELKGRAKHFFSIHRKMVDQRLDFEEIYDLFAVRVIVDKLKDCYVVLGLVHDAWKPIPGRFRDYIAMPKSNGYQSLHTTVIGPSGRPVEIQIRTREMHRIAEYGVAAHWRYKEGSSTDKMLDQKMAWLRQMLEWQSELKDAKDFMESLKIDLVMEEVFVFTPKGDVFNLPINATPVDFAYRIHTEVGHRCVGAKVNGSILPLDHPLQQGDIVEVITGKKDNPSKDWLGFVKTAGARVKIKNWFKRLRLAEEKEAPPPEPPKKERRMPAPAATRKPRRGKGKSPIVVAGLENILVRMSKCCYPIPGEEIIGFVTHGRGIAIHRSNCKNVVRHEIVPDKVVKVVWEQNLDQFFPVQIEVEAFDRVGVLKDILEQISETGTNVANAKISTKRGTFAVLLLTVDVRNTEHLGRVVASIKKETDVYTVKRK
ncbi:MAG: bifunctional (p)ppGpp synthetase/guanosine-3',5'-bis(diphosphate) 3'-pyrophosphohydrolase [Candidatus Margulisiibacteriota bacterium]